MAPDEGTGGDGADQTPDDDDHEEIREIVRQEIHEVLDGLATLGGSGGDDDGDGATVGETPSSVVGIEDAMRGAVEKAMQPLRADIAKLKGTKKPPAAKSVPEPTPEEPKRKKLMEKLWS